MRRKLGLFAVLALGLLLSGTVAAEPVAPLAARMKNAETKEAPVPPLSPVAAKESADSAQDYVLGTGDKLRLTVYGEDDLSGDYEVSSTGTVALPLIGEVEAANRTVSAFETAVRGRLAAGYLRDPRVSVQVLNYRPFFILGEVAKPGSYPYVNGMTVLNAVALAGGYTYRASTSRVTVVHANDSEKKERPAAEDSAVMPGDILRVPERFF